MKRTITMATAFVAASLLLNAPSALLADDAITVTGEYIEYENSAGNSTIGPFVEIQAVFHAANLGPAGIACDATRAEVLENTITFTFDPNGGKVKGTGLIELKCEYHPGCGAVTRTMTAEYRGDYHSLQQPLSGTVEFASLDAESTSWGTGPDGTEQCLDRWTVPGQEYSTNWTLSFAEHPATGFNAAVLEGGDPTQRFGFFTVASLEDGALSGLAAPEVDQEPNEGDTSNGEATEETSADSAAAGTDDNVDPSSPDSLDIVGLLVTIGILFGVSAVIMLLRSMIRRRRTPLQEAARLRTAQQNSRTAQQNAEAASAWFSSQATHVVQPGAPVWVINPDSVERGREAGREPPAGFAPLPLSISFTPRETFPDEDPPLYLPAKAVDGLTVIYDPTSTDPRAVTRTGAHILVDREYVTPLPGGEFTPTHELTGSGSIHGQNEDRGYAYQPGTPVQVLTTTGDRTLVRVDKTTEMWVPHDRVGPPTA